MTQPSATGPYCTTCGYALTADRCELCGGSTAPLTTQDAGFDPWSAVSEGDHPDMEWATAAWRKREYERMLTHCLTALGIKAKSVARKDGRGYAGDYDGVPIWIGLSPTDAEIAIETPLTKVPATLGVAALRIALELCHRRVYTSRVSLRRDLLLLRFSAKTKTTSPTRLTGEVRALVRHAREYRQLLSTLTDAPSLTDAELDAASASGLEPPISLDGIAPERASAQGVPRAHLPADDGRDKPGMFQAMPSILQDDDRHPTLVQEPAALRDDALAAAGEAPLDDAASIGPAEPVPTQASPRPAVRRETDFSSRPTPIATPAVRAPQGAATVKSPAVASSGSGRVSNRPAARLDADSAPADPSVDPKEKARADFCDLLYKSHTLGTMLSFEDRPATMLLLVRATSYRAIFNYVDRCPGAVAKLFSQTADALGEIHITAPGRRSGAMQIPDSEPLFQAMEKIAAKKANIPEDQPVKIAPITSVAEAKTHLARYVAEIDSAPPDPDLRHFLALGALCELLVRTKLPGPTVDKLRGIVVHAQKEGPVQGVIDLMMTALKRIIG